MLFYEEKKIQNEWVIKLGEDLKIRSAQKVVIACCIRQIISPPGISYGDT
jgi:hypothetical protein